MAKFSISAIGIFEIVPIFLPIFYISINWLILLMHCLVVTIFTVLIISLQVVGILLLLTVYNEFYYLICPKYSLLCISDWLSVSASF